VVVAFVLVAPAPAPVLLVVVFEPLLLVVEFEVEPLLKPLPERPVVPDWMLTIESERLVVASRLPEPTVVPDRMSRNQRRSNAIATPGYARKRVYSESRRLPLRVALNFPSFIRILPGTNAADRDCLYDDFIIC
jgi:hypothetical protein